MVTVSPAELSPAELRKGAGLCAELESGNILYFAETPFAISAEDREVLLGQKQSSAAFHKNVAYRPAEDRVTGLDKSESAEAERLRGILQNYSRNAARFLGELLPPYAGKWKLDYASYRPIEEKGRPARLHARNDLPHVDAFPTRPTNGDRILRLFTNINPLGNRVWITAPPFAAIAPYFAKAVGLPARPGANPVSSALRGIGRALNLPGARRSPYDQFMHECHNAMKEDTEFQRSAPKQQWEFPPNSTWMVLTDCVSHAVLSGQYALEQTFIISRGAMVRPEMAPAAILERLAGYPLTNAI
ncbi:MAG TPA: Kdo hydroxylase family protein [Candidatus Dormibacteraeota bacterium]|nr:Kdo hydroxylase family protein [Candidatus Dormibacteraeota bacterium]